MHAPRLLISDVDRTLLTHGCILPERVADALAAACAGGVHRDGGRADAVHRLMQHEHGLAPAL